MRCMVLILWFRFMHCQTVSESVVISIPCEVYFKYWDNEHQANTRIALQYLGQKGIYSRLSDEKLCYLYYMMQVVSFAPREKIVAAGDTCNFVFIALKGTCKFTGNLELETNNNDTRFVSAGPMQCMKLCVPIDIGYLLEHQHCWPESPSPFTCLAMSAKTIIMKIQKSVLQHILSKDEVAVYKKENALSTEFRRSRQKVYMIQKL